MKIYRTRKAKENILNTYDRLLEAWGTEVLPFKVPTRYGTTHINVFGREDAPPVVLFHGVGDDSALMWIYNAAVLAPHFRLYAVDTLGGPGKSIPNENYTKEFEHAEWIDDLLDGLELKQVDLAGVSHGGYLAQYYAVHRPERVGRVVSMASGVPAESAGHPMKTMLRVFLPEALFPTKKNVIKLLTKLTGKNTAVFTDNPLIVEHYTYLLRGYNNMAMSFHKVNTFTNDQINDLRGKTLYLIGERDPFYILGGGTVLQTYQMNRRLFEDTGHGINHEMADDINPILIEYFSRS
ncbi:alpha/beta fold hydrolase [Paenibacillus antibioticophila]|uniref:alpha/beta fold hydrolase n=1 Tax=Paenibacillus antibioticophila TaxID=1274374 RepID=UPI0005C80BB8|nr:alpha/beta hydrolase [Paenibacillus antibioticophila]